MYNSGYFRKPSTKIFRYRSTDLGLGTNPIPLADRKIANDVSLIVYAVYLTSDSVIFLDGHLLRDKNENPVVSLNRTSDGPTVGAIKTAKIETPFLAPNGLRLPSEDINANQEYIIFYEEE